MLEGGEAALEKLIGQPESFELEFKTKEDDRSPSLSKGDKQKIGKELSGFSNADGGVLIYGIATRTKNRNDSG